MDPEHSFDSDTSEWSVIDIKDNEHMDTLELSDGFGAKIKSTPEEWIINNSIIDESNGIDVPKEYENSVQDIRTQNSSTYSPDISSSTEQSKIHPDCQVLYKGKEFQNEHNLGRNSSDFNWSKDSFSEAEKIETDKIKDFDTDTDSISIISESECNDLKLNAHETGEVCNEKVSETIVSGRTHSNVLRRKRKRLKLNCRESSEESVSSDFMIPDGKYYSSFQNIDYSKSNNEMQVAGYQSTPVYKHYRNNVANTVLTLAMGIIFTGVACIAIGHFLGVHDAQQTAGEMMETLKRLEMENILLHSCLTHLSRAFFSRGSSKLEFRANVEPENCLDKYFHQNIHSGNEDNLNHASPIKNSILFRGGFFDISTNMKESSNGPSLEKPQNYEEIKILDGNHDQLDFINMSKYEENYSKPTYTTTTSARIAPVCDNLLPPRNNILDKKEKIAPDGKITDKKVWKFSPEDKDYPGMDQQFENGRNRQDNLAVREKDLSQFHWFMKEKKKKWKNMGLNEGKYGNGNSVCIFPQPEEFYKSEMEDTDCDERLKLKDEDELKVVQYPKHEDSSNVHGSTRYSENGDKKSYAFEKKKDPSESKKEKKREKEKKDVNSREDDRRSSSVNKNENFQRKNGKSLKKIKHYEDNFSKGSRKYSTESIKKNGKVKECRKKGDRECNFKPHSKRNWDAPNLREKIRDEDIKDEKNREKYSKGEKVRRIKLERETNLRQRKMPKNFHRKKSLNISLNTKFTNQTGSCDHCRNKTAEWLYKWAEGREKCRRDQKMSQWQFDRAKSRASSRNGDAYWQFGRALARENIRRNSFPYFMKRAAKRKGFYSDTYFWI